MTMTRTDEDGTFTTWFADGAKIKSKKPRSTGTKGYLSGKTCQQGTAFRYLDLPAGGRWPDGASTRSLNGGVKLPGEMVALAACHRGAAAGEPADPRAEHLQRLSEPGRRRRPAAPNAPLTLPGHLEESGPPSRVVWLTMTSRSRPSTSRSLACYSIDPRTARRSRRTTGGPAARDDRSNNSKINISTSPQKSSCPCDRPGASNRRRRRPRNRRPP